jgi:hypothetical protein
MVQVRRSRGATRTYDLSVHESILLKCHEVTSLTLDFIKRRNYVFKAFWHHKL